MDKSLHEEGLFHFSMQERVGGNLFFMWNLVGLEASFHTWNSFKLDKSPIKIDPIQLGQRQRVQFSSNTLNLT